VLDVTFQLPLSSSGRWWARQGHLQTRRAVEERRLKKAKILRTLGDAPWDAVLAVVLVVLMLSIAQVAKYVIPFILAFLYGFLVWLYQRDTWSALSAASGTFFVVTMLWAVLRFA
jgi:hypothetical protein